jgi:hypothetical protein
LGYLRTSIAKWSIDLDSAEAIQLFRKIGSDGIRVFREQPGFVRYRLMKADRQTTVAVAEWENEELGRRGAENYRQWMRDTGIWDKIALTTYAGEIVAAS